MIEKAPEIMAALESIVGFLDKVGVPGLILIICLAPTMLIMAMFALDFIRQRHIKIDNEERRKETEEYRKERRRESEEFRQLVLGIQQENQAKHDEVVRYYKESVELLKATQRMAQDMRDIIINNTTALQHLTSTAHANFFCPVARELATGKK